MIDDDRLLTVSEAATLLHMCPNTVRKLARVGDLPSMRVGHRVNHAHEVVGDRRFWMSAIMQYLADREAK